jgi:hypothetical protein
LCSLIVSTHAFLEFSPGSILEGNLERLFSGNNNNEDDRKVFSII